MRVLLVTGSFPPDPCGVGDYTFNLAQALSSLPGIHVAVLTSASSKGVPLENRIEIFPLILKWRLSAIGVLARVIWRWSPHIVHIQYPTQGYVHRLMPSLVPIVSFLMGKKVVQTWHEGYSRREAPWFFLRAIVPGRVIVVRPNYWTLLAPLLRWLLEEKKTEWIGLSSTLPRSALNNEETGTLHHRYLSGQERLVVFFGFLYRHKGVERLFMIADPAKDRILIAGVTSKDEAYRQEILGYTKTDPWRGKADILGFLPNSEIADLLRVADAVILPFCQGGGEWNSSLRAAIRQGTFVLTTSKTRRGYDKEQNVYYAKLDDLNEMRTAFEAYVGTRRVHASDGEEDPWNAIATKHHALYENLCAR